MNDGPACCDEPDRRPVVRRVVERHREFGSSTDLDALVGALSKRRRRYLVYLLAAEPRSSMADLAERLQALEAEVLDRGDPDRTDEDVLVSLIHRDVPVLADAGVVTVDEDADVVARGDRFDDALDLLDGVFG